MKRAPVSDAIKAELQDVMVDAHAISKDVGHEVEAIVRKGLEQPLTPDEAARLLTSVIMTVKSGAIRRNDAKTAEVLATPSDEIIERIIQARERVLATKPDEKPRLKLVPFNGIDVAPVLPTPWFHGRSIQMNGGFVRTLDIKLWDENDRLQIHFDQFKRLHGRPPSPEERHEIMLSQVELPGVKTNDDGFAIKDLARSIASNGVRKAPIIDLDGKLLDGNRRLAACHYLLASPDFSAEQKKRIEYIYVWQLTEHATDDDRKSVVVSLNFEDDCKQPWPKYVKARRVYEEWLAMLAREPKSPGAARQQEMKRELSHKFALGPKSDVVTKYIKMVRWADEFEEYLVVDRSRDAYEVKHRANKEFEYFDEISKGDKPGGVAFTLEQNEPFKHLVFDLLFEDKFLNWNLIRKLKYYDEGVHEALVKAREDKDVEHAAELVETTLNDAHSRNREKRVTGAEQRISDFIEWLEGVPPADYARVKPDTLHRLVDLLKLVEMNVKFISAQQERGA